MTVYDLVQKCVFLMGDNKKLPKATSNDEPEFTPEEEKLVYLLKECFNNVCLEIDNTYYHRRSIHFLWVTNNRVYLNGLSPINKIIKVVDYNGNEVPFTYHNNSIELANGGYYLYATTWTDKKIGLYDDLDDYDPTIPVMALVYGTMKEYYLVNGMVDEYKIYEQRFNNMMREYFMPKKSIICKKRRWR